MNEQRSRGFSLNICRVVSETSHLCLRHVPCLKGSRRLQYLPVAASVKWIKEMRAATSFVLFLMVTTISGQKKCQCVEYNRCADADSNGVQWIDLTKRSCTNSLEICCDDVLQSPTTIERGSPSKKVCGQRNAQGFTFRVIGDEGNEAQFAEFPWMVMILEEVPLGGERTKVYECGGSLIHPSVVMTAAHCVSKKNPRNLIVRAGDWDHQTTKEPSPHQDRYVSQVIVHEKFNSDSLVHDVALIVVNDPFKFADNVQLACLPRPDEQSFDQGCMATGWGQGETGKYQVILKRVDLPIVDRMTCEKKMRATELGPAFRLHDSFICAGGIPDKDTCTGDGGSPLVCPIRGKPSRYQQVGIVSWGIKCGTTVPAAYANVAHVRSWIDNQMKRLKFNTDYDY